MQSTNLKLFEVNHYYYFLVLCALYALFTYLFQVYIFTEEIYFQAYQEQLSYDRIEALIQNNKRYAWLNYALIPVLVSLKVFCVALCLFTGAFFFEYNLRFTKIFQVALVAEGVYLVPVFIKAFWFLVIAHDYTFEDISNFDYFSLLAVVGRENLEIWWTYILYSANLFEFLYWLALAYGLRLLLPEAEYDDALKLVLSSYGVGLLFWIVFICFLLVSIS